MEDLSTHTSPVEELITRSLLFLYVFIQIDLTSLYTPFSARSCKLESFLYPNLCPVN